MVATVTFDAQSVVVITGSSRGLGLEFVKQLLDTTTLLRPPEILKKQIH